MDDLGPIEIEFIINNPEVSAQAAQAESTLQDVTDALAEQAQAATAVIVEGSNEQFKAIERLRIELTQYKVSADLALSPEKLVQYNQLIEQTSAKINQLGNAGKTGFDDFGNAIPKAVQAIPQATQAVQELSEETEVAVEKQGKFSAAISRVTDIQNIGARVVSQFSRQIIGLGVSFLSFEIGAKAIETLIKWVQNLDYFTGRLDVAKQTLDAFKASEIQADKTASSQIANLEILYDKTQDVTKSIQERVEAAEALRTQFPAEFQNTQSLAIVNGQAANSYRDLAASILQVAESQAASAKITEAAGKILDAKTAIGDAKRERDLEIKNAQLLSNEIPSGAGAAASGGSVSPRQAQIDQANYAYNSVLEKNSGTITTQTQVVKNLEQYVTEISAATKKLQDANGLLGNELEKFNNLISGAGKFQNKQQLDNIQSALQTVIDNPIGQTQAKINQAKADLKQVDDLEKLYQVKATKTTVKVDPFISGGQTALAEQTALLQNIDALKQKYAAKDADRETQSLYDIQAAFTKEYNEVVAFNVKRQKFIDDYNLAHKNTGGEAYATSIGYNAQDPSALAGAESSAISAQADLNENAYIQQDIEKKKKLYADYQAYRLKVGDNIADADYADLLKSGKDFQTYLGNIQDSINKTDTSGPIVARAAIVKKYADETAEATKVELQNLTSQYADYETRRAALIGAAEAKINLLIQNKESEQALIVAHELKATLDEQDAQQAQRLLSATQLTASLLDLTKQQAKNQLDAAQAENDLLYAQGKITAEVYNATNAAIKQGRSELNSDQTANYLNEIGSAFSNLSGEVSKINSGFGSLLSSLGSTLTTFNTLYDLSVKIKANGGLLKSLMGKDPKDAIAEITTGLNAVLSIVNSITSASAQRKQAEADYYNSVLAFQQQYNVALDEQVRLQYQTAQGSIFYTDNIQELSDGVKAYDAAQNQYNQSLVALQQGQAIVGTKNVVNGSTAAKDALSGAVAGAVIAGPIGAAIGGVVGGLTGLFGGKKATNVLEPLLQTYPQLIDANGKFNESLAKTLVANNQVSDATKTLLNNTISYYDEEQTALDQITSTLKDMVGQLGDSITSALVTAFENGTSAAEAFQQAVSSILSNIIEQDLFVAVFGQQLDALQTKLTADVLANDGDTQAEIIADITNFYKTAAGLVPEYTAGLQAAQSAGSANGLNIFPAAGTSGGSSSTSLSGQISGITADQATMLEGSIEALRLSGIETNDLLTDMGGNVAAGLAEMKNQTAVQMQIAANTLRSANNSDLMVASLSNIDNNTSSTSLVSVLRAAGK